MKENTKHTNKQTSKNHKTHLKQTKVETPTNDMVVEGKLGAWNTNFIYAAPYVASNKSTPRDFSCSQVEKSRHYVLPVPKVPEILKNNDKYYYMKLVAILCCSVDGKLLHKEKQF